MVRRIFDLEYALSCTAIALHCCYLSSMMNIESRISLSFSFKKLIILVLLSLLFGGVLKTITCLQVGYLNNTKPYHLILVVVLITVFSVSEVSYSINHSGIFFNGIAERIQMEGNRISLLERFIVK